jgi:RNA polymerase sigma factor (sigma-70 family)
MNSASGGSIVSYLHRTLCAGAPADVSDEELLGRFVAQRDEIAFAALLRRHGPMVWGVCARLLGHCQDAEDAFQATFLVLACKAASIGRRKQLANWLFGVARRAALNLRTVRGRRARREQAWGDPPDTTAIVVTPWDNTGAVLDEELARMPQKYRLPLLLCGLEGMTHAEAGKYLGWPKGTVSGRLSRARDLLRIRLLRRGVMTSAALAAALTGGTAEAVLAPQLLVASARSAALLAAGKSMAPLVSPAVATLMRGVLLKMSLSRLSITVALAAALTLIVGSAGATWLLTGPAATAPSASERLHLSRFHVDGAHSVAPVPAPQLVGTSTPGKPSLRLPADPNAVVLRMERSVESATTPLFAMTIYADGRVVAQVADDSLSTRDLTNHAQTQVSLAGSEARKIKVIAGTLCARELEELLRFALHDQEFFDFDPAVVNAAIADKYQSGGTGTDPNDATTTAFRVQTADRNHEVRWPRLTKAVGDFPKVERLLQLWAINRRLSHLFHVILAGGRERVEAVVAKMNELDLPNYRFYPDVPRLTAADLAQVTPSADGSRTEFTFVRIKDNTFFKPLFGVSITVPAQGEPTLRYVIPPQ